MTAEEALHQGLEPGVLPALWEESPHQRLEPGVSPELWEESPHRGLEPGASPELWEEAFHGPALERGQPALGAGVQVGTGPQIEAARWVGGLLDPPRAQAPEPAPL